MFENVKADMVAACDGRVTFKKFILKFFARTDFRPVLWYRINRWLYKHGLKAAAHFLSCRAKRKFGAEISPVATIGRGFRLMHGWGSVVGAGSVIGANCTIYQQVTIGTADVLHGKSSYPVVADEVIIYAGAKVLGAVRVGRSAVIAANAVVVEDVPAGAVAGGIPAKIIKDHK